TLMLVDPEPDAQRQLLVALGARGHRVVPATAEGAADIAQRMKFDAVLWALRGGGGRWSDFHERVRPSVPVFVLVNDRYDQALAQSLDQGGGFLLSRPIQDDALERVLGTIGRSGA